MVEDVVDGIEEGGDEAAAEEKEGDKRVNADAVVELERPCRAGSGAGYGCRRAAGAE